MSVNVQVTPSVTQNPNHNHNNEIAIDIRYNNYIEGVFDKTVSFTLPIEDGITWDNIFGTECSETESECRFEEYMEEYLEELEMDCIARSKVIEDIAEGYLAMKETRADVELGSSCLRALSVVVEIHELDEEVQGLTMDLDQDYDTDSDGDGANDDVINDNNSMDVKEIRAFLETCGVSFSKVSSSGDNCSICLETMQQMEGGGGGGEKEVARLPCNHVFHGDCVVEMVLKGVATHACPLCRMELIVVQS